VGDRTFLPLSPSLVLGNEREAPLIFESGYRAGAIWPRACIYIYIYTHTHTHTYINGVSRNTMRGKVQILWCKLRTSEHSNYIPMLRLNDVQ
jgi:hypothetical protein